MRSSDNKNEDKNGEFLEDEGGGGGKRRKTRDNE